MKKALLERRTHMLKLPAQGVKLETIEDDFSREYGVSKKAIYMDWYNRERWTPQIVQLNDPSLINELLVGLKQVISRSRFEATYKDNQQSVKLGTLKLVKETYMDIIRVLQSIGKIETVSEKVDVVGKLDDEIVDLLRQYNEVIERVLNRTLQKDSFGE